MNVKEKAKLCKDAVRTWQRLSSDRRNQALDRMASQLESQSATILAANGEDLSAARQQGISGALLDRLTLDTSRIAGMACGLRDVASLADPLGQVVWGRVLPNGLTIHKVQVPLGVIGMVYEARPNVTADASGLCLKAGNGVILRGGREAIHSNRAIVGVLRQALMDMDVPVDVLQIVENTDREEVHRMMRLNGLIDVIIPRGGAGLIRTVMENSTVPVIETGVGNCHTFVDDSADLAQAVEIVDNAKTQRPGVCNALETLLVHTSIASKFLPQVYHRLQAKGVSLRGCGQTLALVPQAESATDDDWATEYLDLILAVRVVNDLEEALAHINRYSTGHSEAILTSDYGNARRFLQEVDAAAVYVNASTRFTDGGEFGMGAEIGISTQKLHARGPMGLAELTTTKFVIYGDGHVRS